MTLAAFINRSQRETENWKYTNLERLLAARSQPKLEAVKHKAKTRYGARLVFVNGGWDPEQSCFGSVPSCIMMGDLNSGYKISLGEHTCLVAQPIELVFTTDENAPPEIAMKIALDVGRNGRLTLLANYLPSASIHTLETEINLQAHAKLVHCKIVRGGAHIALNKVHVAAGAYYNNVLLQRGSSPVRNETDIVLAGEQAQTAVIGAMLLRGSEHGDTTTRITHQAAHCSSRQIQRTVLNDKARGVFQGKICVAKDAQKSDGYQLSRALLLSDQAEMDAKPELEIYADDVKCSHGCTVGDLDEDAMFYLRTRGLDEGQARALLIEAFVAEMLDEVQVEEWRKIFRAEIEGWAK
jgi:Fe-S cluster assembly protein SufD